MTAMPSSLLSQTEISGRVDYIRYHNAESGYCVLAVETTDVLRLAHAIRDLREAVADWQKVVG